MRKNFFKNDMTKLFGKKRQTTAMQNNA